MSQQGKADYNDWQRTRVRISNLIARKPEIKKICCICGNAGEILHNRQAPYYIAFICHECRRDPDKLIVAEESRQDIRTLFDKKQLAIAHFTDEEAIIIVVGFMNGRVSMGNYCTQIGISRYQFNQIVNKYDKLFPSQHIKYLIENHSNQVQAEKLRKIHREKAMCGR